MSPGVRRAAHRVRTATGRLRTGLSEDSARARVVGCTTAVPSRPGRVLDNSQIFLGRLYLDCLSSHSNYVTTHYVDSVYI
jgi:hypothetical protein